MVPKTLILKKPKDNQQRYDLLDSASYIVYAPSGIISEMYCKVCGTLIAYIEDVHGHFVRTDEYAEIKIKFNSDQSNHVTNACVKCVSKICDDTRLMLQVMQADVDIMESELPGQGMLKFKLRTGPTVVAVDLARKGIP